MSLLMDALKQAEKAKGEAPGDGGNDLEHDAGPPAPEPGPGSDTSGNNATVQEETADGGLSLAPEEPPTPVPAQDFETLSDPDEDMSTDAGTTVAAEPSIGDPRARPSEDIASDSTVAIPPEPPAPEPAQATTAAPPAATGDPAPEPEIAPTPAVSAAGPDSAAHLLSASRGYETAERRRLLLVAAAVLVAIALAVGFYYLETLEDRPIPVPPDPETVLEGNLADTPPPATVPAEPAAPAQPQAPVARKPAPPATPVARAPSPPPRAAPAPRNRPRIVRATRPGNDLLLAYQAYQAGRLAEARELYLRHLKLRPRSRDALLGLGAIALHEGRLEEARERYRAVLALDPRDATARAALASIERPADIPASEAELQVLLRSQPAAPHLHFALGNLYAAQGRWPLAQQHYFEALRLDDDNPDYAYNLAVSLDRLGEQDEALTYYRRALDLNHRGLARFDSLAARARIQALAGEGSETP